MGGRKGWWERECSVLEEGTRLSQDSVEVWSGDDDDDDDDDEGEWRPAEWRMMTPTTGYSVTVI